MNHLHTTIYLIWLIFLKSDWIGWSPLPGKSPRELEWGHMTGKTLSHDLFKMASQALIEVEAFSCLRQSIARFLLAERAWTGLEADHPVACAASPYQSHSPWADTQSMSQYIDCSNRSGCQSISSVGKSLGGSSQFMSLHTCWGGTLQTFSCLESAKNSEHECFHVSETPFNPYACRWGVRNNSYYFGISIKFWAKRKLFICQRLQTMAWQPT